MSPDRLAGEEERAWRRIRHALETRLGRPAVRSGRFRMSSSDLILELETTGERAIFEGVLHGKSINPVSIGRWLKEHLVNAPLNGLVLRSSSERRKMAQFWIAATGGEHDLQRLARDR